MNDCRGWSYVRRNQVPRLFASNVPFTILGSIEELADHIFSKWQKI
jgi:hypothetical protein